MSRRSRKHRKRFDCGHRGFGRYCHACANRVRRSQQKQAAVEARRVERQRWQATFEMDAVDLRQLPTGVTLKARDVLSALEQGAGYWQLAGRRLHSARRIIRIPVTRRYRLLCRDDGARVTPLRLVSHEDYNLLVGGVHRWLREKR